METKCRSSNEIHRSSCRFERIENKQKSRLKGIFSGRTLACTHPNAEKERLKGRAQGCGFYSEIGVTTRLFSGIEILLYVWVRFAPLLPVVHLLRGPGSFIFSTTFKSPTDLCTPPPFLDIFRPNPSAVPWMEGKKETSSSRCLVYVRMWMS